MSEIFTFGETMAVFTPKTSGALRYVNDYTIHFAGAESNTAIGLQKLGHTAKWFSRIGNDELGQFVLSRIRAEGVDTSHVIVDDSHRTGLMIKEFSNANDTKVYYYRDNSAASFIDEDDLSDDLIAGSKILHFTGITPVLSQKCLNATNKAVEIAQRLKVKISFDPNIRLKLWNNRDFSPEITELMVKSNIVMLGLNEAEFLYHTRKVDEILDILFQSKTIEYVAIKDGSNGAHVADRSQKHFISPYECNCIDPIGAGDAFNAGFLCGILEQAPLVTCGNYGGIAGAIATQTLGDIESFPSKADINNYLKPNNQNIIYR